MSKSVWVPVEVADDGTFSAEYDGSPWGWVDEHRAVWNYETDEWESSSIESDNADLVSDAEERVARASRLLEAWEKVEDKVTKLVERHEGWTAERRAIFDVEAETGHLDHHAIHDNEDEALDLLDRAMGLLEGLR